MLIRRQLEYRGVELVVVLQPDGSLACTPAWMTREAAAQYALSEKPRFSVDILRSLRAAADVLLRSLLSESKTEKADHAAPMSDLAALLEALLREIAIALANRETGDEQGHD